MKKIFFLFLLAGTAAHAQELFVYTEPASNMPKNSLGVRLGNMLMKESGTKSYEYRVVPELMWGTGKSLMLHADAFISNQDNKIAVDGGSFYAKYRLLSNDDVHAHFRLAAFVRYSFNNSAINNETIDLYGQNSGYQAGVVATQLLNKVALSASTSYLRAMDNGSRNKFPSAQSKNAVNYTFSFGKLLFPKVYTDYKQTNVNLMLELLGQTLGTNGKSYLDVAPSLQFIINSQARIDIGYRHQLYSSMYRTAPNGLQLRLEYLFFNAFK